MADPADELYGLLPEQFVPRRTQLAKEAKAAGDREQAAAIAALRKPSTAAWALNTTVRADPSAFDGVLALGAALRAAQHDLAADELRSMMRDRHAVVGEAVQRVRGAAESAGRTLSEAVAADVEAALRTALADEGFGAALRRGRLVGTGPGEQVALDVDLAAPRSRPESTARPATTTRDERAFALAALRTAQQQVEDLAARRTQLATQVRTLQRQLRDIEPDERRAAAALADAEQQVASLDARRR